MLEHRAQNGLAGNGLVIWLLQHHRGVVRGGPAQVLVHDAQNIQLVRIAHHVGDKGHQRRRAGWQGKTVVHAHGGHDKLAGFVALVLQATLGLENAHPHLPVVARFPVAKGVVAQILLKAAHIMVQSRQQTQTRRGGIEFFAFNDTAGVFQHV